MNRRKLYFWMHLLHGVLILLLILSGAVLYIDYFRILFVDFKWQIRQLHTAIGFIYFAAVLFILPNVLPYVKAHRRWQKTFHICLMITLAVGWTITGFVLWINPTSYLGFRQLNLAIHDTLSVFILIWVAGHVLLWFLKKKKLYQPQPLSAHQDRDQGMLVSRRDVVLLFSGGLLAILLGGLFRWFQPVSDSFLARLDEMKRRGYFRIYSVRTENPVFDPQTWRLSIDGLVENPVELSFDELMRLPKHTYTHDFHCVTGWSVLGVKWEGIPFQEVINLVGRKPEAKYIKMYSADRIYTETYEWSQLTQKTAMLVYNLDDKPLIESQGAPLRLFHPDMYGYKSIKWVNRIEFVDQRELGYWEEKEGYDLDGYIS